MVPWRSFARLAPCLVLAAAAYLYIEKNFFAIQSGMALPSDFQHYYDAGARILHGGSPYAVPEFIYPPVVAFAMAPLALTSYVTARWIWFFASHVMLLGAGVLIWRFLGRGLPAACCCAIVWGAGGAAGESLALGQVGPLLALLLALTYTTHGRDRGIAAGAGAALKVLPGVVALPMALARDWRSVISMIAVAALLILIPAISLMGFEGPGAPQDPGFLLGSPAILSWSIPSAVLRALDPPVSGAALPPDWEFGNQVATLHLAKAARAASAAASLMVATGGVLLLIWRTRGRIGKEYLPVAMAGTLSLALAAAPVCWSHYQVLQYPGVALMLGIAVARRQWSLAAAITACAALLYPVPVAVLTHYYHRYGWTSASPWQLYLWTSLPPVACLGIFGLSLNRQFASMVGYK